MKLRFISNLSLFAVLLTAACASAATESAAPLPTDLAVQASLTPLADIPSPTLEVVTQPAAYLTATPVVEAQPIATSRGPDLHATDPTTVTLAAGQLHFVEFFRFT